MYWLINKKRMRRIGAAVLAAAVVFTGSSLVYTRTVQAAEEQEEKKEFIKWVDFNVPYETLEYAMKLDIASHNDDTAVPLNWIELLAYAATRNGGNFSGFKNAKLDETAKQLREGKTMAELTENLKNYSYFYESYNAALGGLVGPYEIQVAEEQVSSTDGTPVDTEPTEDGKRWIRKYGLKAFSPIAKNYPYNDYDDFGSSRSYGYKRRHLGHDMMGATGTPIIAVEGGTVEAIGWNQYGGWRIGIRSFDKKRYYYYAHLRQNFPFNKSLEEGSVVNAGDVIGYLGHTGYSAKENTNNIDVPHLHFGMELIFDESQKESDNEIWIDVYAIIRLLYRNRSEVVKDQETKEYSRIYDYREVLEG